MNFKFQILKQFQIVEIVEYQNNLERAWYR